MFGVTTERPVGEGSFDFTGGRLARVYQNKTRDGWKSRVVLEAGVELLSGGFYEDGVYACAEEGTLVAAMVPADFEGNIALTEVKAEEATPAAEEVPAAPATAEEENDAAAIASLEVLMTKGADVADTVVVRRGTASTRLAVASFAGRRDTLGKLRNAEVAFEYADMRYGENPKLDAARNAVLDLAELAY